jgi:release factor glutamine methyltransferase
MNEIFNIRNVLEKAKKRLVPVSDSAGLDAQLLLSHVMGVERAYLFAHPEQIVQSEQRDQYAALVARAAAGEPLPYILGKRAFFDREFIVTSAVLIPRPETELLLENALAFVDRDRRITAVDVGTGSGALAVTLAAHRPLAEVYAIDISPEALAIAQSNAESNKVSVNFLLGDLLQPVIERQMSAMLVMANLPYINTSDLPELAVSRYEPRLALDGGADGLDLVRRLLSQAPSVCKPGGLILLEIGAGQGARTAEVARAVFPDAEIVVLPDFAGHDRIVRVEVPGNDAAD